MLLENSIFSNVKSKPTVESKSTADSSEHCSNQNFTFEKVIFLRIWVLNKDSLFSINSLKLRVH